MISTQQLNRVKSQNLVQRMKYQVNQPFLIRHASGKEQTFKLLRSAEGVHVSETFVSVCKQASMQFNA